MVAAVTASLIGHRQLDEAEVDGPGELGIPHRLHEHAALRQERPGVGRTTAAHEERAGDGEGAHASHAGHVRCQQVVERPLRVIPAAQLDLCVGDVPADETAVLLVRPGGSGPGNPGFSDLDALLERPADEQDRAEVGMRPTDGIHVAIREIAGEGLT